MGMKHYRNLAIMSALHFVAMYVLMYAMVDTFGNVFPNYNQFYMAGLMTAPMVILELFFMKEMYTSKRRNIWIVTAGIMVLVAFWIFIREQNAITDKQFLKSMIPHHAGALLMCEEAPLDDPEIRKLCINILSSQKQEIDQMKSILERLER